MQNLIAFQFTGGTLVSPIQLPSHPVENGITIINNSALTISIYIASSSGAISTGAILRTGRTYIPLAGGNTDQIWVGSPLRSSHISVIGT